MATTQITTNPKAISSETEAQSTAGYPLAWRRWWAAIRREPVAVRCAKAQHDKKQGNLDQDQVAVFRAPVSEVAAILWH
jgi:hypothetical protein